MLFTRSERRKGLKIQHLAGSQGVVCKICELAFLVAQALPPAISLHLLRVVLAIFLPIGGVRLAPLPQTVQADLLVQRIRSYLLLMIIGAALALASGLGANMLLRMITVGLKDLPTVTATAISHQMPPEESGRGSLSLEAPLDLNAPNKKIYRVLQRLCR
jgi:hypothetical protein